MRVEDDERRGGVGIEPSPTDHAHDETGPSGQQQHHRPLAPDEFTFTPEGAEKMRRMTQEHIGEHLELLIDGKVVMAPLIRIG